MKNFLTAGLLTIGIASHAQTKIITEADIKTLFQQAIVDKKLPTRALEGVDGCECMPYEYTNDSGKQALLSYCPDACSSLIKAHFSPSLVRWTQEEKQALLHNLQSLNPSFR